MGRAPEVPLWKRHIIIGFFAVLGKRPFEIAKDLELSQKTVEHIIRVTKTRCHYNSNTTTIEELIEAVKPLPRSGRPKRAEPGSSLSLTVREGVQQHDTQ